MDDRFARQTIAVVGRVKAEATFPQRDRERFANPLPRGR
jgi:hypothetical protein